MPYYRVTFDWHRSERFLFPAISKENAQDIADHFDNGGNMTDIQVEMKSDLDAEWETIPRRKKGE